MMNSWIKVKELPPLTWEEGDWDGLRSDPMLVKDSNGQMKVAVRYSGFMDGSEFSEYYTADENEMEIKDVVEWMAIKEDTLEVHDIRNKLSTMTHLIFVVERENQDLVKSAIPSAKRAVNYLAQREVYPKEELPK